ncbi:glycosyltransferase [Aerosakkonemataceae cyanobacterium BLCC-F50]|uniref:Glycosyltransferase n=1 Tax=Floridaenema flaviceps BLCC-F50 TaxID=3153642 RepID=A0ABV4Y2K8_9CYAN
MTKETKISVTIDGYRLSYPATGLGLVTAELLRGLQELGYTKSIAVFVEKSFRPQIFGLENLDVQWITVDFKNRSPDYLGRLAWGLAVTKKIKKFFPNSRHFIPYFYNYGNLSQNVVLVPDLVWRIVSEQDSIYPHRPWWNLRGRLPFRPMFVKWEEWLVTRAKNLIVYTKFVKNQVHQEFGTSLDRIMIMQHPVPSWCITKYQESNNLLVQNKFNLPHRFVLYVGGFAGRKNVAMLLEVCGQIYDADPSFRCVLVGLTEQVIQRDFGIREAMKRNSVRAAIIPLPIINYPDLAALYRLTEFTVYPSLSEGFGLPILEAGSAKRLCLCGDNSSMKEVQTNAEYRIKSDDRSAWFEKILYFWQNPEATKKAGEDCHLLFHQYDLCKTAQQLWNILQS